MFDIIFDTASIEAPRLVRLLLSVLEGSKGFITALCYMEGRIKGRKDFLSEDKLQNEATYVL